MPRILISAAMRRDTGYSDSRLRLRTVLVAGFIRVMSVGAFVTVGSCAARSQSRAAGAELPALERAVARYAATYVYHSRPMARLALDTARALGQRRSPDETAELMQILRATTLAAADSAVICNDLPSTCRMRDGYDAIVSFRLVSIDEGDAQVAIELRAATGLARSPIVWETRTVRFVRRGQAWEYERVETIEVS